MNEEKYLKDENGNFIRCDYIGCNNYAAHRIKRARFNDLLKPIYGCNKHLKDLSTDVLSYINENGEWETKELYCSLDDHFLNS